MINWPSRLALVQQFTRSIAPPVCVLCGGQGQVGSEAWGLDLCVHCEAACLPAPFPEAMDPATTGCDVLRVLFLYRPPVDRLVTQLKFAREPAPARVLGMLFARKLRHAPLPQCLVPMPLHPQRLRERGFNQSELICRHLASRIDLRVDTRLLERMRHTEAQSTLPAAARSRNVAGAFRLAARAGQPPESLALLDDVMTTGSTLAEAAGVLRAAGVKRIEGWICARALREQSLPIAHQ
jgi:ComF family protein